MTRDFSKDESTAVHAWRSERLHDLGVPPLVASALADDVDWHQVESLIERGCDPILALEIAL